MPRQAYFFNLDDKFDSGSLRISAGTTEHYPGGQQGSGDILIALDRRRSTENQQVGRLQYPDDAELTFEGSIEQMRELWMQHGNRYVFLRDPRFTLLRM